MTLNLEQTKGLANFFFDIAKGLVLGAVGFTFIGSVEARFIVVISSVIPVFLCVKMALLLLEEAR